MFGNKLKRISIAVMGAAAGLALLSTAAFAWSGYLEGRPNTFHAGASDGYYIWHNDNGLHLRTTDNAGSHSYTGTLWTDGTFADVDPVKFEADDHVEVLDHGHRIRYQFKTAEGIDGIDFRVSGGEKVVLRLDQDGELISTSDIFLGEDGVHPNRDPFVIRR